MPITNVEGQNRGDIMIYALSTCIWCKKAKQYFDDNKIAYRYIFMDLAEGAEKAELTKKHKEWNPSCSFPTIVFNNSKCVVGFDVDEIQKELK